MNHLVQETRTPDYSKLSGCQVWVLGAGVSGLTTAIVLQALGIKTGIVSEALPYELASGRGIPQVPSLAAMATAYPHNLQVRNLMQISDNTQLVFDHLLSIADSGVKIYRMFEVFEEAPEAAPLSSRRRGFQSFDGTAQHLKGTINPPVRSGAEYLWGWTFETYFADMPVYLRFLYDTFVSRGGIIENGWIEREDVLASADGRPVFNCLGWRGRDLFEDTAPETIIRGKQVLVPGAPWVYGNDGLPLSYNYTPTAEVYSRADGKPEYVHFFPRIDGWLLGQTREPGRFDSQGNWTGDEVVGEKRLIGDELVPAAIVDLNADLLKNWTGHQLNGREMLGREGYRYYRDPLHTGVRLNCEKFDASLVFHNYGHGGSGITMSWGCAVEAARTFVNNTKPAMPKHTGSKLDKILLTAIEG